MVSGFPFILLTTFKSNLYVINFIFLGVIQDLYIDYNKFKGNKVKAKVPQLLHILENYEFTNLINFFLPSKTEEFV